MFKNKMKLYIAGPITGGTFEDVEKKWAGTIKRLKKHYTILSPLFGKAKYTRPEMKCEASEGQKMKYLSPITTDRAIVGRDHWMVEQSDIVFVDLIGSKIVSIGSVCEITAAYLHNKHVVVAMEEGNIHRHAFVLMESDIVFPNKADALDYIEELGKSFRG